MARCCPRRWRMRAAIVQESACCYPRNGRSCCHRMTRPSPCQGRWRWNWQREIPLHRRGKNLRKPIHSLSPVSLLEFYEKSNKFSVGQRNWSWGCLCRASPFFRLLWPAPGLEPLSSSGHQAPQPGNLTAGLAARMPNFRDFAGLRPGRTGGSERWQPTTNDGIWPPRRPCGGVPNTSYGAR